MKYLKPVNIFLAVMFLTACAVTPSVPATNAPLPTQPALDDGAGVITLGDISDDPSEASDEMQPIADYLAARLGEYGITRGEVRVTATADEMSALLKTGEVDLYFDSLYPATLISQSSGAEAILRRWRSGVGEYHTVIYSKKDGDIKSIEDLRGKMVAMDNPFSTSGYLLPSVYLLEKGYQLAPKKNYGEPVAADEIGFVFSYDDQNAMQWVVSGLTSAGVTDNAHWAGFPADVTDKLLVLAETQSVPRQVALAQPNMDDGLQAAIIQLLVAMHENEEGQAALLAFDKTARFDEFPEGIAAAQADIQEMIKIINQITLPDWVFEK